MISTDDNLSDEQHELELVAVFNEDANKPAPDIGSWICILSPFFAKYKYRSNSLKETTKRVVIKGLIHGLSHPGNEKIVLLPPFTCWVVSANDSETLKLTWRHYRESGISFSVSSIKSLVEVDCKSVCSDMHLLRRDRTGSPRQRRAIFEGDGPAYTVKSVVRQALLTQRSSFSHDPELSSHRGSTDVNTANELAAIENIVLKPFLYYFIGAGLLSADIAPQSLKRFGFVPGQRCQYGTGPKTGRVTTIVGCSLGKLWHHEDGGELRPFHQTNFKSIVQSFDLELIGWDRVYEYPKSKTSFHYLDYNVNERLMEQFGRHHNEVIQDPSDTTGYAKAIVVGCRGDELYVYSPTANDCKAAQESENRNRSLFTINFELLPPNDVMPRIPFDDIDYEVRCSQCRNYGALHGQTVIITSGFHVSELACVLGISEGTLYGIFLCNKNSYSVRALHPGNYSVINRPIQLRVDQSRLLHHHPRYTTSEELLSSEAPGLHGIQNQNPSFQFLTFFGERIDFDIRYSICNIFRYAISFVGVLLYKKKKTTNTNPGFITVNKYIGT